MSRVQLKCYDLSRGFASMMGRPIIGLDIEGVWHTGVLVHGLEFFYGGGIQNAAPEVVEREYGMTPKKILDLGTTNKSLEEIRQWCGEKDPLFSADTYDFLKQNCNHFSDALVKFLLGKRDDEIGIPIDIVNQHEVIGRSPRGGVILTMIEKFADQAKKAAEHGGWGAFLASGRPVNKEENVPLSSWSINPTDFERRIRALWEDGSVPFAVRKKAIEQLLAIASNIVNHATDERFRTLKAANPRLHETVTDVPHGSAALQGLGFMPAVSDDGEAIFKYSEPTNRDSLARLQAAVRLLKGLAAIEREDGMRRESESAHSQPFENQLRVLKDLGFDDEARCLAALQAARGNINQAIDRLVQGS